MGAAGAAFGLYVSPPADNMCATTCLKCAWHVLSLSADPPHARCRPLVPPKPSPPPPPWSSCPLSHPTPQARSAVVYEELAAAQAVVEELQGRLGEERRGRTQLEVGLHEQRGRLTLGIGGAGEEWRGRAQLQVSFAGGGAAGWLV